MFSTAFTRDGTIFVIETQRDRPRPARSLAALERLIKTLSQLHDQTRAPGGHGSRRPDPRSSPAGRRSPADGPQPVASVTRAAAAGRQSAADARGRPLLSGVRPPTSSGQPPTCCNLRDIPTGERRSTESVTGVRRRFGGDICRFVSASGVHSKCE